MRFERKYVVEQLSLAEIRQLIKLHPAGFRQAFPPRVVNNIYFDSPNYAAYQDNLKGIGQRKKIRLRWYGTPSFSNTPLRLEEKIKEGLLGYKIVHSLSPPTEVYQLEDILPTEITKEQHLIPTLFNQYHRHYYVSADRKFRITIDDDLSFGSPKSTPQQQINHRLHKRIILELKYEEEDAKYHHAITQHLPFRLSKNSKYVIGVELILS